MRNSDATHRPVIPRQRRMRERASVIPFGEIVTDLTLT